MTDNQIRSKFTHKFAHQQNTEYHPNPNPPNDLLHPEINTNHQRDNHIYYRAWQCFLSVLLLEVSEIFYDEGCVENHLYVKKLQHK